MKGASSGYILQPRANQQSAYANIANLIQQTGQVDAARIQKEEEEKRRRREEKNRLVQSAVLMAAAAATGGAAALAAPAVAGAAGAGAGAASGGFMSGLSTFGQGALGALTGTGAVPAGTGGLAGGLSTIAGGLGRLGGGMLQGSEDPLTSTLGSYFAQTQQANKVSNAFESTLKQPEVRNAMYGDMGDEQAQSVMRYAKTLGSTERANFYQMALPQISKFAEEQRKYKQQQDLLMDRLRTQRDIAGMPSRSSVGGSDSGYRSVSPSDLFPEDTANEENKNPKGLNTSDLGFGQDNFKTTQPTIR